MKSCPPFLLYRIGTYVVNCLRGVINIKAYLYTSSTHVSSILKVNVYLNYIKYYIFYKYGAVFGN